MSLALIVSDWQLPGCDARCSEHGHSPMAHETYGRRLAQIERRPLVVRSGPLVIHFGAQSAAVDGAPIHLTPTEWRLLAYLAESAGQARSHQEILDAIWPGAYDLVPPYIRRGRVRYPDAHRVRLEVSRLRGKLGVARDRLVTVIGRGYRLDADEAAS